MHLIRICIFLVLGPILGWAGDISACFTPPRGCTQKIVQYIDQAQQTIHLQAYSFTSQPIAEALVRASQRGIKVRGIFDKSQLTDRHSRLSLLQQTGIEVMIDRVPGIAHNKVMIIDGTWVITGSFNFTQAAETRNAENVLFIQDSDIAEQFLNNWRHRWQASYSPEGQAQRPGETVQDIVRGLLGWVEGKLK